MRFAIRIVILAKLLGGVSAVGQNVGDPDAASKVLALERLWGQGAHLRDVKALDSIFDEGLVNVDIDGD